MTCEWIKIPGTDSVALVCGVRATRKSCRFCKDRRATKLCDFPLAGAKAGQTCDAPMCDHCATSVGPDRDYCPPHVRLKESGLPVEQQILFSGGNE